MEQNMRFELLFGQLAVLKISTWAVKNATFEGICNVQTKKMHTIYLVPSRSTSRLVTCVASKNKSCPNELKFCEDS